MPNERKLTKAELNKREDIVKDMKKNKRALVKKYGKDAEQVMYGRATKMAKQKTESMNQDKLREMIQDALKNPKAADLNKDGELSDYEKKRGAAIEKNMNRDQQVGENYHKDLPNQRPLTPQEKELITNSAQKLEMQGKGYDWDQDTAIIYFFPIYNRETKNYTGPEAEYTLVVNRDTLHKVTLPKGARVVRVLGNMNYTDAYKSSYEEKRGAAIEKSMVKEWGSSDQSIMNQSIHRDLGEPKEFPGLSQIMSAAEDAVDFYWDDWDEYQTDRDGLIMSAAQRYARQYHPEFMAMVAKMVGPIDEKKSVVTENKQEAFDELQMIMEQLYELSDQAKMIFRNNFPTEYRRLDAYGALDFGTSSNRYDVTLEGALENLDMEDDDGGMMQEDLDLGHQDNEPGMLKGDLYKIGKYSMELYQMMDDLENVGGEVDFPHWWQSKIITAKNMISGAKHYLDFEMKEPEIDAMVRAVAGEDVIDEDTSQLNTEPGAFEENLDLEAKIDALQRLKRGEIDKLPSVEDAKAALVKRVLDKLSKDKK